MKYTVGVLLLIAIILVGNGMNYAYAESTTSKCILKMEKWTKMETRLTL